MVDLGGQRGAVVTIVVAISERAVDYLYVKGNPNKK